MLALGPALAVAAALAAGPRLAVMPIAAGDAITDKSAAFLTEALAAELRQQSGGEVSTTRDLASVLSLEKQKQALGCATDVCMAELAGAAGADRLVAGDVAKLGESLLLQLRLLDTRQGRVLAQSRRRYKNGTFDDVLDALPAMVSELLEPRPPAPAAARAGADPAPATAQPHPATAKAAGDAIRIHYHRRDEQYGRVALVVWESSEAAGGLRRTRSSIVPRAQARVFLSPALSRLPLTAPGGRDAFGAYWDLPAARFKDGRVNFVVAVGGDWDECGIEDGRYWLVQDGREAWYVGAPDCQLFSSLEAAKRAAKAP